MYSEPKLQDEKPLIFFVNFNLTILFVFFETFHQKNILFTDSNIKTPYGKLTKIFIQSTFILKFE